MRAAAIKYPCTDRTLLNLNSHDRQSWYVVDEKSMLVLVGCHVLSNNNVSDFDHLGHFSKYR